MNSTSNDLSDGKPQRAIQTPLLLEVENLVVEYSTKRGLFDTLLRRDHNPVHALDGVSLTVASGEIVALVGESGSGKTTAALSVIGMVKAASGTVQFAGRDLGRLPKQEAQSIRRRFRMIYQDPYESLDPRFRVMDTVAEAIDIFRIAMPRSERRARVIEALSIAGLKPPELYLDRYPHELSGGQRQRVAIAAALVIDPELLVADEPVSMLDVSIRAGVLQVFDTLRSRGLGIIMISHDLASVAHLADRIYVMYLGRIVEEGLTRDVLANPRHPYTQALASVVPKLDPSETTRPQILAGDAADPTHVPAGCRFHPRGPRVIDRCSVVDPVLESVVPGPGHRAACIRLNEGE